MLKAFCVVLSLQVIIAIILAANNHAYGDSFSCSYGKQAACLDYGDKVCSSSAKCVGNDSVCFDSYTCDYNGFVCKSKFNDLASEYDGLLKKCKSIASEHDDLVGQYNDLLQKYKNKASEYEELQSCISYASTLGQAKSCP